MSTLPVELLREIAAYLSTSDLAILRLAATTLREIVDPLFFSVLNLPSNRLHLRKTTDFIRALGTGKTGWSSHATALVVLPAKDEVQDSDDLVAPRSVLVAMPELLVSAIHSCPRLHSFRFSGFWDPNWLYDILCKCVLDASNPRYLDIQHNAFTPSLPSLQGLSTLKISTPFFILPRRRRPGTVVKATPHWPRSHMLDAPLPSPIALDQQVANIVRKSRQLRVLHIIGGDSWDCVWRLLRDTPCSLVSLKTDLVSPALVEYLKSSSGLQRLVVRSREDNAADADANVLFHEFFNDALPMHRKTLRVLRCQQWFFETHNAKTLAQLDCLTDLEMRVRVVDVLTRDADNNAIRLVLQTIAQLERLERVALLNEPDSSYNHRDEVQAAVDVYLPHFPALALLDYPHDVFERAQWDWLDVALDVDEPDDDDDNAELYA
ncbi:F-box domain-containing protein [Mycena chlorophos]|uniref:F-box domain-containing protein n=1 Tax=Mycena chlorophos TaxID=658473 RepID=A0A8H6SXM6_MYCCL|nr:F-box domain-containing protein [Mycena chlorophos]